MGLMMCFSYAVHYATAKKVDALQNDVDDLMSMMRVLRYRALQDDKGGDD